MAPIGLLQVADQLPRSLKPLLGSLRTLLVQLHGNWMSAPELVRIMHTA